MIDTQPCEIKSQVLFVKFLTLHGKPKLNTFYLIFAYLINPLFFCEMLKQWTCKTLIKLLFCIL